MKLYSIKDVKMGFLSPVMRDNDDIIKRDFLNMVTAKEPNFVNLNPEDYELWCIANFDISTGLICPCLEFVCNALSFKE